MHFNVRKSKQPVYHVMGYKNMLEKAMRKDGHYEVTDEETKRTLKLTWDENMHLVEYFGEYQALGHILAKHELSKDEVEKAYSIYRDSYYDKATAKKWDKKTSSLAAENLSFYFEELGKHNLSGAFNRDFFEVTKFFRLKIVSIKS